MDRLRLRIAHLSDPHILSPAAVDWRKILFNKRITGYANLVLRRGRVYRREYLLAVLEAPQLRAPIMSWLPAISRTSDWRVISTRREG